MITINIFTYYRSRSLRRPNVNTPSGSVVLFSLRSPLSRTCGAPSRSTTSLVLVLSTAVRIAISIYIRRSQVLTPSHRVFLNQRARNKEEIYGSTCSRNNRNYVMLWLIPSPTFPPLPRILSPVPPTFSTAVLLVFLLFLLDFFQPRNLKLPFMSPCWRKIERCDGPGNAVDGKLPFRN